jgi:hypothetical protein
MGTEVEATFESDGGLNERNREGTLVDGRGLNGTKHISGILGFGTINDNDFVALASDPADPLVGVGAVLDSDFEVAQDAAENPHSLVIRA